MLFLVPLIANDALNFSPLLLFPLASEAEVDKIVRRVLDHLNRTSALVIHDHDAARYARAAPFPHMQRDDMFPDWLLKGLDQEWEQPSAWASSGMVAGSIMCASRSPTLHLRPIRKPPGRR